MIGRDVKDDDGGAGPAGGGGGDNDKEESNIQTFVRIRPSKSPSGYVFQI
jgi:hypothetical protein